MGYDHRGAMATMTQAVRSPETGQDVEGLTTYLRRGPWNDRDGGIERHHGGEKCGEAVKVTWA
jgi:hypothetical protein